MSALTSRSPTTSAAAAATTSGEPVVPDERRFHLVRAVRMVRDAGHPTPAHSITPPGPMIVTAATPTSA